MTSDPDTLSPRVLHSSRRRTTGLLAISLVFAVIGVLMAATMEPWGWAILAFGAVCTAVFVYMLVRPSRLELTADGLKTVTLGRRWSASWAECSEFRTWKDGFTVGSPALVIFDCSAPSVRGHVLETAAIALSGANAALPETYGMKASELADLLNRYRRAATA